MPDNAHAISAPSAAGQNCPTCGAAIPAATNYATWCDQCNWNLSASAQPRPTTLLDSFYVRLGARLSGQLFTHLQRGALRPRLTLSRVLALGIAALVHLTTLGFALLGVWLLGTLFPNPIPTLLGGACLALAWLLRPQLGKLPYGIADPQKYPVLYDLTNRIAQTLGARPVKAIKIDADFNASYTQLGWRREQLITVGLPLFAILAPQERIAILAHEVAHGVNGDQNRSLFVGSAIDALGRWYGVLRPDQIWGDPGKTRSDINPMGLLTYLASAVANVFLVAIAYVPWCLSYALSHLLWRDSQRAEYLADGIAARVSGTAAMLGALEKLHYGGAFRQVVQSVALMPSDETLVTRLRAAVTALPGRELERIRRSNALELARLDVSHPPTTYRIELLQTHPVQTPQLVLTPEEADQLEQELLQSQPQVQRDLIDAFRRRLYY